MNRRAVTAAPAPASPPVYVVSGGDGTSGEQLLRTVLAQFPGRTVPVRIVGQTRTRRQVRDAVRQARRANATIVHTLVEGDIRRELVRAARDENVVHIDLVGRMLNRLASVLGVQPVGRPGRYRDLYRDYFDRVEAIEFAVEHDDGQRPEDLGRAEVVLVGASRVGKTPLSIYLSVLGWKAANVPFVRGLPLPEELSRVDARRVVGIVVDSRRLRLIRETRERALGLPEGSSYGGAVDVRAEAEAAARSFQEWGWATVDATNKPIEESAEEVVSLVERRLGDARGGEDPAGV